MTNITLKKVTIGNPLYNLGLLDELDIYNSITTDEDLVNFYHYLLEIADYREKIGETHELLRDFTYSMIAFSTGYSFNPYQLFQ